MADGGGSEAEGDRFLLSTINSFLGTEKQRVYIVQINI